MAEGQASLIRKSGNLVYKKNDIEDIEFEDFINPWSFCNVFMSEEIKLVNWLMNRNLLAEPMKCANCEQDCRLGNRSKNLDGVTWRCLANRSHETSVQKFSFFLNRTLGCQIVFSSLDVFYRSNLSRNVPLMPA